MSTRHDPEPRIHLYLDEADELVELLRRLEDWISHTGSGTFDDITHFFNGPGNGRLAVAGLVSLLGNHACILHRRLKDVTP